ncbi:ATP-binding protein [Paenibacillus enshidis]|uniref:ATP-binding protein n=1 Tax=Paenibacillus enshidis TaxID=1458439 RepID=A0ABV5AQY1_9BACL
MNDLFITPNQLDYENNPPYIVKYLKDKNEDMYSQSLTVYRRISSILNTRVSQVFPDYTLHDVKHSLRIMNTMALLVPSIEELSELEILFLIYGALLHDIGMGATAEEIESIKSGKLVYGDISYTALFNRLKNEKQAIQEFIRKYHALRSAEYVKLELEDLLIIPNMTSVSISDEVALLCQSHTEDFYWLKNNTQKHDVKGVYQYNLRFCAILLRLGDILDFDSERTPPKLFLAINPQGISKGEWEQHFVVQNAKKVEELGDTVKEIRLHGKCDSPHVYRKVLGYIDWINNEIENSNYLLNTMEKRYQFFLNPKVSNYINTAGYTFTDLRFNMDYSKITHLLMGERIYGSKKYGLRELIQNSIDACRIRRSYEEKRGGIETEEYIPTIKVIFDKYRNFVKISDNGIGMNINILKNFFLSVGSSYYNSSDFLDQNLSKETIGNYGIGFLSCFMLSSKVVVKTKYFLGSSVYEIELLKDDEYVSIKQIYENTDSGTEVILDYQQFMSIWQEDMARIKSFLETTFLTDDINIQIIDLETQSKVLLKNTLTKLSNNMSIDLSKYLTGITGNVPLQGLVRNIFSENISTLGETYYFNGQGLIEFEESNIKLLDLVVDEKIHVIDVPLIEEEDVLSTMIEALDDDIDEALYMYIEKKDPQYISILTSKEYFNTLSNEYIEDGEELLKGLPYSLLCDYGQSEDSYTIASVDVTRILTLKDSTKFLEIEDLFSTTIDIFIKGVFVKSASLLMPNKLKNLKIDRFKVNISLASIVPLISRNDFDQDTEKDILNSIYQAILLGIYEQLEQLDEKKLILTYLKKYHFDSCLFLREDYIGLIKFS